MRWTSVSWAAVAYFAIAEALTNVAKHCRADSAMVRAHGWDDRRSIVVCDDGVGGG